MNLRSSSDLTQVLATAFAIGVQFAPDIQNLVEASQPVARRLKARDAERATSSPTRARTTKTKRRGRKAAAVPSDTQGLIDRIVALLEASPEGLRSEGLRETLSADSDPIQAPELARALKIALKARAIRKTGKARATLYFAKGTPKPAKVTRAKVVTPKRARKHAGVAAVNGVPAEVPAAAAE